MPWPRPTLTQLRQLARSFYSARLPGADATLRRSNLYVTSDVVSGMANGTYGYLDYIIGQNFASTAQDDYLLRIGSEYDMSPNGATQAAGSAIFTGTNGAPINTPLQMIDSAGNAYNLQASGSISGSSVTLAIEAAVGGSAQNLVAGAPLQLSTALPGVNATATVASPGLSGGADGEDVNTAFRARVLARKAQPPQGGDGFDYVAWALTVAGVTRAWIYPLNRGGGTVDLTFVMDGRTDIIPLTADVANVQAVISDPTNQPVTDDCIVFAPVAAPVNFTIQGVASNTAVQAAIEASLADLFATDAVPGGAYNVNTQATMTGTLSFQDQIDPAVAAGAGGTPYTITSPTTDVTVASGEIATLGTITWI